MSMTLQQTLEAYRPAFEETIFKRYFISMVGADLRLKGPVKDKAAFCTRDEKGEYTEPHVGAAWWGYCEGLKTAWRNGQDESIARRQLYLLGRMAEKFKDGVSVVHQQDQERGDFHISVATSSRGQLTVFRYALGDAIASLAEQLNVR